MWKNILSILDIFTREFWLVTCQMAPWLLFGFLIAGVLSVFFSPDFIKRHLGRTRFGSILKAALFGVPLPLCSCGVIPVTLALRRHGASKGATASFLISTPQTGVDSIIVTWSMLGWVFAVFKVLTAFIAGIIGGVAVDRYAESDPEPREISDQDDQPPEKGKVVRHILKYGFVVLFHDVARPLFFGLVIAAAISTFVPETWFTLFRDNNWASILLMLIIGIPIYVCSTASVPIAAALIMKGISPGAALVFLIAGPATNIATITTMFKVIGRRGVFIYLATIALIALISGVLMDLLLTQVPKLMELSHGSHSEISVINQLAAVVLLLMLFRVLISGEGKAAKNQEEFVLDELTPPPPPGESTMQNDAGSRLVFFVPEANCEHCVGAIKSALALLSDVDSVAVNIASRQVCVTFNIKDPDVSAVKAVLSAAGFTMKMD